MSQSVSFDPVADRYDNTRTHPPEVAGRIAESLLRLGHLSAGSDELEIGIGTGRIALPLLARGVNVTGVDISERMVERLRAKYAEQQAAQPDRAWGRLTIEMADMTALPFAGESFDAVIGVHVLHLVPQWRRALDEALRVVRVGGAFLLGQDVHDEDVRAVLQDQWILITRALGIEPLRVGAGGYSTVVAELRARGLAVEESIVTSWAFEETPSAALRSLEAREWSRTWNVPEDVFAESIRQLTTWVEQRYAGQMETPQRATYSFKVGRVLRPDWLASTPR